MISASVPVIVTVFVPFPEIADAVPVTLIIPLFALTTVCAKFPSTSVVLIPVIAVLISSVIVCVPGTVLIGASFSLVTVSATISVVLVSLSASVEMIDNVSEPIKS